MAVTAIEIADLRQMVAEPEGESEWADDQLSELIDTLTPHDLRATAAVIWERKAAQVAAMVNTNESGSSRSLGDMHKNYLALAGSFRVDIGAEAEASARSATTRPIQRRRTA